MPTILLVNKADLLPEEHADFTERMRAVAEQGGFDAVYETSAQTFVGVDAAMRAMIELIMADSSMAAPKTPSDTVDLEQTAQSPPQKDKSCC